MKSDLDLDFATEFFFCKQKIFSLSLSLMLEKKIRPTDLLFSFISNLASLSLSLSLSLSVLVNALMRNLLKFEEDSFSTKSH